MEAHPEMYAPRFATHRNTPLKWDHKINLVGVKDPDPMIHNCEKCNFPIMSYGRMIPCKHVFCFDCAKATDKSCLRCGDSVQRIEQSPLGSIYLCTYGAPKHSHAGCRRTYLSHRDLQAHINHRHKRSQPPATSNSAGSKDQTHNLSSRLVDPRSEHRGDPRTDPRGDPRSHPTYSTPLQEGYTVPAPAQTSHIMPEQMQYDPRPPEVTSTQSGPKEYRVNVPVRKSNLITVPLHDTSKDYHDNKGVMMQQPSAQPHTTSTPYPAQAPMVPVPQHQVPPPPPPPQHVPYPQHPPASIAHVPPISHASSVSSSYTVPVVPISAHQVPHSMHPPQAPIYTQPAGVPPPMNAPHYDTTPRPPFPTSSTHPVQNPPFPSPGIPIQRPGWPVGPPPPTSMPPPPPPQVPAMVNQVPAMPPQPAPGTRPEMVPPPIVPMSEAPRYHGQYFTG